ncbi:MAG: immunity 42 family protein [Ruminococcus sp.]|nr:immunity 42 family protein [Ruminococcus sp.]
MVIGEPYKMAFILERMAIWEPPDDTFRNGIMFLCVNGEIYPKDVRTTTFYTELPFLLAPESALMNTVVDKELFALPSSELLAYLERITYPDDTDDDDDIDNDYRFVLPFEEISDRGFDVFLVSDGENVRVLVGQDVNRRLSPNGFIINDGCELASETTITLAELESIRSQLSEFYNSLK